MDFRDKIIPFAGVAAWRERVQAAGKRLVVSNGRFDIRHAGHITYLAVARAG
jgi:bifunctional ADP-heptose synthase (sugar kinase/adenylyltransferase)